MQQELSSREVAKGNGTQDLGGWIRQWRERRGLSQRDVARSSGVGKSTIHYLEKGAFQSISLNHLERIAQAMGLSLTDFFNWREQLAAGNAHKGSTEKGIFRVEYPSGAFQIVSYVRQTAPIFFGRLTLSPKGVVGTEDTPHADQIFYLVTAGRVLLQVQMSEYVLRQGEYFLFNGTVRHELYNPDPIREAVCLLVSIPSFLLRI